MKVRLVAPAESGGGNPAHGKGLFPPLSLAVLGALTPEDIDVEVVDENVSNHDFDAPVDLVGITSITATAPRAYRVAAEYRARGVPVVMGGMHASALPGEALEHVDAVVVGEAEGIWERVLQDARSGMMSGEYRAEERPCLEGLPVPRKDLFDPKRYITTNLVQTSRGCPNACTFCAVSRFFGRTYRMRPVEDVVREVAALKNRLVLFVDDNIAGHRARAKELFRALKPLGVRWMGQSSLAIAEDPELLDLAADSGCVALFIGFESLNPANLRGVGKGLVNRAEGFLESVEEIHRRGIGIEGAFIFGMDEDDESVFDEILGFAKGARLALAQFGILTPFPGTPLFEQMEEKGRIVEHDWSRYTISNVVTEPLNMSREALQEGFNRAYREFYSYRSILSRLLPGMNRSFFLFLGLNVVFKRVVRDMLRSKATAEGLS